MRLLLRATAGVIKLANSGEGANGNSAGECSGAAGAHAGGGNPAGPKRLRREARATATARETEPFRKERREQVENVGMFTGVLAAQPSPLLPSSSKPCS